MPTKRGFLRSDISKRRSEQKARAEPGGRVGICIHDTTHFYDQRVSWRTEGIDLAPDAFCFVKVARARKEDDKEQTDSEVCECGSFPLSRLRSWMAADWMSHADRLNLWGRYGRWIHKTERLIYNLFIKLIQNNI